MSSSPPSSPVPVGDENEHAAATSGSPSHSSSVAEPRGGQTLMAARIPPR
jgi:hypothetical protein